MGKRFSDPIQTRIAQKHRLLQKHYLLLAKALPGSDPVLAFAKALPAVRSRNIVPVPDFGMSDEQTVALVIDLSDGRAGEKRGDAVGIAFCSES